MAFYARREHVAGLQELVCSIVSDAKFTEVASTHPFGVLVTIDASRMDTREVVAIANLVSDSGDAVSANHADAGE